MEKFEIDNSRLMDEQEEDSVYQRGRQSRVSLRRPSHNDWGGRASDSDANHGPHERDRFNNYFEYLLSVLGFSAGFGSLWRFPYLVYKNGGGAFLIPYFILMFAIGIPTFYFETVFGQFYQKGPAKIYETLGKRFKGFGFLQSIVAYNEATYYNLILAYSLYYLWQSLKFPLPWKIDWQNSDEPWNKDYFYNDVLQSTESIDTLGGMVWPIFYCYALSQVIVYLCVQKGVAVSGRIALFTATSPYVLLFVLMLRGFTLDGAYEGISYFLTPDMSKLLDLNVWTDAAAQVIFQFSLGMSVLVFFASYRDQTSEVHKSSILIPCLTCFCGFLSGFAVFSYMGYMSQLSGIPIDQLPLSGPDLTFIAYPAVLTMLPFENLWAIVFFSVMLFLGIDTQFGFMDGIAGTVEDEFGTKKGVKLFGRYFSMRVVRFFICASVIITGLLYSTQSGFYYLEFVDFYTTAIPSLFSVGFETYLLTHNQDWNKIEYKIIYYTKTPTPKIYIFFLKYVVPTLCFGLGTASIYKQITMIFDHSILITLFGWFISLYPFAVAIYYYQKHKEEDEVKEAQQQQKALLEQQQY